MTLNHGCCFLPEKDEEGEPQDPRQELVERLLEHKLYKYMSYELRDRQSDAAKRRTASRICRRRC